MNQGKWRVPLTRFPTMRETCGSKSVQTRQSCWEYLAAEARSRSASITASISGQYYTWSNDSTDRSYMSVVYHIIYQKGS